MSKQLDITLTPFQPADQAETKDLILNGMAEHWGRIDPGRNPDLNDICMSYAGATFLVARQQGRIVGCGGIVPRSNGTAEIVRMSIAADVRRQGIGRRILEELVKTATSLGCNRIVLETTATWHDVIAFYERCGFRISHYLDGDVYFVLDLQP
jgi:putative acetyltransferase